MKTLPIVGCICAMLALVFLPAVFALLAMIIGVVTLTTGKMEHGLSLIVLAGVCGYYTMASWKPLDGFPETVPIEASFVTDPGLPPATPNDWRLLSLQTRLVSTNNEQPVYAWKLVVRNESFQPEVFHGAIQFQDPRGVTLVVGQVQGYEVPAGTIGVFTGSMVLNGRGRVARAVPQIAGVKPS